MLIAASLGPIAAVGSGEASRFAPKPRCSKSGHLFQSVLLPDTVADGVFVENDIAAHRDGARAVEYVGGHEHPVFGKRDRQLAASREANLKSQFATSIWLANYESSREEQIRSPLN